ncbi:Uncharacterized protein MSYG_4225 [Malassezia sympodialis ATCC 42132]|uniref:Reverse transcriptase domain-containing protein n=1 Tax=Malassezia sympodialis (strain ATCC 42132) TaxID=1230383 RepID=A0A1M8ABY2_MALS4|nr:Uncharacterized protein MSYG_4225 [Malassezia sympodialis ATCC 42132]
MEAAPHLALSSTLQHVAETKLAKLAQRRAELDEFWSKHLDDETLQFKDADSVRRLLRAMENCDHKFRDERWSHNLNIFLDQAERDPFIRPSQIAAWGKSLLSELEQKRARYSATALFSKLVLQWIQNPVSEPSLVDKNESIHGRLELDRQREIWESYAFNEKVTNKAEILEFLDNLFMRNYKNGLPRNSPLGSLRRSISDFDIIPIDKEIIRVALHALLKEDLFVGEKRNALEDLQSRDIILDEIADALRSDLSALQSWSWQSRPIPVHFRKNINGRFRVYMDEEIYQAIFIQIVGTHWAAFLKRVLKRFITSGAWLEKRPTTKLSKECIKKRINLVGEKRESSRREFAINNYRWKTYRDVFFLSELPSSVEEGTKGGYCEEDPDDHINIDTLTDVKQRLLRLITTEILLRKQFYGSAAYFQTDFQWFGPSIPHSTLLTLFEYFDVPPKWIAFFRAFMQPTLLVEEDDGYSEPKKRVRGIPMSHTLSTVFGDLLLFVLDYAVNQDTQGCNIYRIFDDIHFVGQPDSSVTAWCTIQKFTHVMGLTLNEEKSGSYLYLPQKNDTFPPHALPLGEVRWGFLKLMEKGQWHLDQELISRHIREMIRQLRNYECIMYFVHAYNTYTRFFINNAGYPSECLGKNHVYSVIDMIQKVQRTVSEAISDSKHSDVVSLLREKILNDKTMDAVPSDLPDAFFFFPTYLGGLGIYNPFVSLTESIPCFDDHPEKVVEKYVDYEKQQFEEDLEKLDAGKVSDLPPDTPYPPLTFEEYIQSPEDGSNVWLNAYHELQSNTDARSSMVTTLDLEKVMRSLRREEKTDVYNDHCWIIQMYGAEVLGRMGRLAFGERDLMPTGLFKVLRKERARWQV